MSGQDAQNDSEYSVDALFPPYSEIRNLYEKLKNIILSIDPMLEEVPRLCYVTFKFGKRNTVSLWPKSNWIEIVLNAKLGQITDNDLVYDISNRKWSSEQYAFKFFGNTDIEATQGLIKQALDLKK